MLSDKVAAGVIDNESYAELLEETRSELIILGETEKVVRQIVVARSSLDPLLTEKVKKLLLELDQSEKGRAVLEKFKTTQFDEFPDKESLLSRMWEIYRIVLNGKKDGE